MGNKIERMGLSRLVIPVNVKVAGLPKSLGIYGIKREGKYIFFGWSNDVQKRCGNMLSKGSFGDCEFELMEKFFKGVPVEEIKEALIRYIGVNCTGWPSGLNKVHPITKKWQKGSKKG